MRGLLVWLALVALLFTSLPSIRANTLRLRRLSSRLTPITSSQAAAAMQLGSKVDDFLEEVDAAGAGSSYSADDDDDDDDDDDGSNVITIDPDESTLEDINEDGAEAAHDSVEENGEAAQEGTDSASLANDLAEDFANADGDADGDVFEGDGDGDGDGDLDGDGDFPPPPPPPQADGDGDADGEGSGSTDWSEPDGYSDGVEDGLKLEDIYEDYLDEDDEVETPSPSAVEDELEAQAVEKARLENLDEDIDLISSQITDLQSQVMQSGAGLRHSEQDKLWESMAADARSQAQQALMDSMKTLDTFTTGDGDDSSEDDVVGESAFLQSKLHVGKKGMPGNTYHPIRDEDSDPFRGMKLIPHLGHRDHEEPSEEDSDSIESDETDSEVSEHTSHGDEITQEAVSELCEEEDDTDEEDSSEVHTEDSWKLGDVPNTYDHTPRVVASIPTGNSR